MNARLVLHIYDLIGYVELSKRNFISRILCFCFLSKRLSLESFKSSSGSFRGNFFLLFSAFMFLWFFLLFACSILIHVANN